MVEPYYVGVDVGTASVRAALVSSNGKIVSSAIQPLKVWKSQPNYFEQSSEDIWGNVCTVVKVVVTQFYDLGPPEEGGGELSAEHGGVPHPLLFLVFLGILPPPSCEKRANIQEK